MKRVLIWAGAIVVALIAVAAVVVSRIDTQFVVQKIADATAKATGSPLIFKGSPELSIVPPGVKFGETRWGEIKDNQGMAVSVKSGMARLELAPLFTGNIVVAEVRLDNPTFTLREGQAKTQDAPATAAAPQSGNKAPVGDLPLELMRLVVSNGEVTYADAAGKNLNVKNINLSIENLRRGEEAGIQCEFSFNLTDTAAKQNNMSGGLALTAKLRYAAPKVDFRQVALSFTPLAGPLPKEAGPVKLTCDGSFDLTKQQLHLPSFTLAAPSARISLAADAALSPLAFKGNIDMEAAPAKLATLAGQALKPGSGENFTCKVGLEYIDNILHVRGLGAKLDDTALSGDLTIKTGDILSIEGTLHMGALNLDKYLPLPEKTKKAAGTDTAAKSKTADAKSTPLPNVNFQAKIDGVRKDKLAVNNISFTLKGEKEKYDLTAMQLTLGSGGDIKGSGRADVPGKTYAIKTTATNVNIGALTEAIDKGRPADGTAFLDADMTVRGEDPKAMMASLNGKGLLEIRGMKVAAMASLPNIPGIKGAIPNRFDLVRVPFTATNGEVTAKPVTVSSAELNATAQARASLPREYLDATADVKTLGLTIPVTAKGPFSNISVGVDPKFALDAVKNAPGALLDTGKKAGGAVTGGAQGAGNAIKGLFKK